MNGVSIQHNPTRARRSLGLCPQENIFYAQLTVHENLRLAATLRGMESFGLSSKIALVAGRVGLTAKLSTPAKNLSGGMKRRLCLGCAFIGFNDILIFDEPTSGLDPETRRDLWNVFLELRKVKTILLTTHFMEEADVLGDRIAIINQGRLICNGSPMFLKRAYNTGYVLKVETKPGCDVDELTQVIRQHVPSATLENRKHDELNFRLSAFGGEPAEQAAQPSGQAEPSLNRRVAALFKAFEQSRETLRLKSWGMSNTSLEDVFIKAGETGTSENPAGTFKEANEAELFGDFAGLIAFTGVTGVQLLKQRLTAVFIKRLNYIICQPTVLLMQVAFPLFLLCMLLLGASRASFGSIGSSAVLADFARNDIYPSPSGFFAYLSNDSDALRSGELLQREAKSRYDLRLHLLPVSTEKSTIDAYVHQFLKEEHQLNSFKFMLGFTCVTGAGRRFIRSQEVRLAGLLIKPLSIYSLSGGQVARRR